MPAVKVSIQALTLQMAADKAFGEGQYGRLDPLTVSMAHPDAQIALLSGQSEINAHFSSPPFQYQQLRNPAIHTVLNSYDVLGGPATFNLVWTTSKFRTENPKLYDAFVKALDEATAFINKDKKAAAEAYLRISKDKDSVQEILAMLNDPLIVLHDDARKCHEVRRFHGQDRARSRSSPIRGRTCSFRTCTDCREADARDERAATVAIARRSRSISRPFARRTRASGRIFNARRC